MSENKLTDDERAELEALRLEKAEREKAKGEAAERAELEALRSEAQREHIDKSRREKIQKAHEKMVPDDDLHMPLPQKIILAACAIIFICIVIYILMHH